MSKRNWFFNRTLPTSFPGSLFSARWNQGRQRRETLGTRVERYMIGLKYSRYFFFQSEVRPKPIATRSHMFSRALGQLDALDYLEFDWFTGSSVTCVIG